jgi:hypothetical protein
MSTTSRLNPARNGKGRYSRDMEHVRRDAQAAEMYDNGATYEQVAEALGYRHKGHAFQGIMQARADAARGTRTEELRLQQLAELEMLKAEMWRTVLDPPPLAQHGKIVHDVDGQVVLDEAARQGAVKEIRQAGERIARLRGLDAPRRSMHAVLDIPMADIDARAEELRRELAEDAGISLEEIDVRMAEARLAEARAKLEASRLASRQILAGEVESSGAA